jgi:Zn-dependent M16 (insulinase) family peptidase
MRGNRSITRASGIVELWSGFTALEFIHRVAGYDIAEVSRALTGLRDRLVSEAGLLINITGENEAALPLIEKTFSSFAPPRSRNRACYEKDFFDRATLAHDLPINGAAKTASHEVFSSGLLQTGFAALSLRGAGIGTKEAAAETVLSHFLSTGALWTALRMEGGAYGAHASANSLENTFTFSTYCDPRPRESVGAFSEILKAARETKISDDTLEKTIIGAYAKEKQPTANPVKGFKDFMRFLYNIDDERRQANLKNIIAVSADDIARAAGRLYESINGGAPRIIFAGKTEAKKAARKFKTSVHELPDLRNMRTFSAGLKAGRWRA